MASDTDHSEPPASKNDTFRQATWPYALEWLIVAGLYITFTKEEGDRKIARLGRLGDLDYVGNDLKMKIPQCAFKLVGENASGDEWGIDREQTITIDMNTSPVSVSDSGRVRFVFEDVIYLLTPEKLSPATGGVLSALFT